MGGLVEDLLELARLDETKPLELRPVDLYPIARDAALDTMASSPDRIVTALAPLLVSGDSASDPDLAAESYAVDEPPDDAAERTGSAEAMTGPIAFARLARFRGRRPRRADSPTASIPVVPVDEVETEPTPAIVLAEENKIRQAVTNLLGNAIRYTPSGTPIELAVVVNRGTDEAAIEVIDHGEGIPPQIREKIFQRFWRADTSRTRETGGSGLGLAIVSAIITAHRGRVEVVETRGGGATFRLIFPLLQTGASEPSSTVSPQPDRLHDSRA